MTLECSLFPLDGTSSLVTSFKLYRIRGLGEPNAEYHKNLNILVRRLSVRYSAPFTSIMRNGQTLLAVPETVTCLDNQQQVVSRVAILEGVGETLSLHFNEGPDDLDPARLRFLNFVLQKPLFANHELWQPRAGYAYFEKVPLLKIGGLDLYQGFSLRAVRHPDGGFGVIVDMQSKMISSRPIGPLIDDADARRLLGRRCLYQMGDRWFEVRVDGVSDMKVGEPSFIEDGQRVSLAQYLTQSAGDAIPRALADLDPDGAAIDYYTSGGEKRGAPAALCYLVEDTHGRDAGRNHRETLLDPGDRRKRILHYTEKYLDQLRIGDAELSVRPEPYTMAATPFALPDLIFGNARTLFGSAKGGGRANIRTYSRKRRDLLLDSNAGFFDQDPLPPQAIILPATVQKTWGPAFVNDLKRTMTQLYPGGQYHPTVHVFDDVKYKKDVAGQMTALRALAQSTELEANALVILHPIKGAPRRQDELAAMVVNKFQDEFDIAASIAHTNVPNASYKRVTNSGAPEYIQSPNPRTLRRLEAYIKGLALNKVCLANSRWPFVLKSELDADIVIGIDVKNNMAIFTMIANGGRIIRKEIDRSRQKEQLHPAQFEKAIITMIEEERPQLPDVPKNIVIHRDGRLWQEEIDGVNRVKQKLEELGLIHGDGDISVFEISKSSPASLRFFAFDRPTRENESGIVNPPLGAWITLSEEDGYIANTGNHLLRQGTAHPLHIKRVMGSQPLQDALEDIFRLSCLTWTKPDGCMRIPLSIKLCDISLFEEAGDYNEDQARFDPALAVVAS